MTRDCGRAEQNHQTDQCQRFLRKAQALRSAREYKNVARRNAATDQQNGKDAAQKDRKPRIPARAEPSGQSTRKNNGHRAQKNVNAFE